MPTWCNDLCDLLAAEGAESATIVGHSLGAQLAINFAHSFANKTAGLVLLDPSLQKDLHGRSLWVRRMRWLVKGMVNLILLINALGFRRRNLRVENLRELDIQTREAIKQADSFAEIAKRYSAIKPILETIPLANYLRQALAMVTPLPPLESIDMPVLVLLSGGTTMGGVEQNRDQVSRFKDAELVVLNANHWPLTESPVETREAIDQWVGRTWPAA